MTLRILQIDVPAAELPRAIEFWAAALSADPVVAPGAFVHLVGATSAVEVHVQATGGGSPRYHLDVEAPDRRAEASRLVGLGAVEVARFDDGGYTVLTDPSGLQLCVIDPDAAVPTPVAPREGEFGYLDAIFLDVPAPEVSAEVAFWASVLGAPVRQPADPGWPYTGLAGVRGPGGPVSLQVQAVDAPARLHVDLSAPDVRTEAARLEALGATRVGQFETWITLADPVGNLLCVVPSREEGDT